VDFCNLWLLCILTLYFCVGWPACCTYRSSDSRLNKCVCVYFVTKAACRKPKWSTVGERTSDVDAFKKYNVRTQEQVVKQSILSKCLCPILFDSSQYSKGDQLSLWRMAKLGVSELRTPEPTVTKFGKGDCVGVVIPHCQNSNRSPQSKCPGKLVKYHSRVIFIYFFIFCDPEFCSHPDSKPWPPTFTLLDSQDVNPRLLHS